MAEKIMIIEIPNSLLRKNRLRFQVLSAFYSKSFYL